MLRMKRILVLFLIVAGMLAPSPAYGCSRPAPPTLEELLGPDPVYGNLLGVYEQEHIAGAPNLGVRDRRTVSVVTRYWGQPPRLGREMHGSSTILQRDSCGNESGAVGEVGYGYVAQELQRAEIRHLPHSAIGVGGLSQTEEALLNEAFGAPVELRVSWQTRLGAHAQLWLAPMVVLVPLAALSVWGGWRLRRRLMGRSQVDEDTE